MAEPTNSVDVEHIDHMQRKADETTRYAAIGIGMIGGPDAVHAYLHRTLNNLLDVAIHELGRDRACELMAYGFVAAENHVE